MRPALARRLLLAFAVLALALAFAPAAFADAKTEAVAKAALKKAKADYAAQNYGSGATRLQKVVKACGESKCTAPTKAALLMDLGAMQFKKGAKEEAAAAFVSANKLQPGIAFDPAFDSPEVRAAFAQATGTGSTGVGSGGGSDGGDGGGVPPTGDFGHSAPTEQAVNTPLPIYVDGGPDSVARVVVKYKPEGSSSWKRIDLKHLDGGWGGLIPCGDVKSGTLRYYVQGLDEAKTPVGSNGNAKHPYLVKIKDTISGDAPHLPGKDPPKSCSESSDCPPDFPGCSKSGDSAGDSGDDNGEGGGEGDEAEKPKGPFKRWWAGIGADLEFVSVPANSNDVCALDPNSALPTNSDNLYCTDKAGGDFPTRSTKAQNAQLCTAAAVANGECPADGGGKSAGGLVRGNLRVMASLDYAVTQNVLLGARLGVTLFNYQGQAASNDGRAFGSRFFGEARGTYVWGDGVGGLGFRPLAMVGGGVGEFDGHVTSGVAYCNAPLQKGVPCQSYSSFTTGSVNVWKTAGPGFAMLGGGVRWNATDSIALTGAIRLNIAFGSGGVLPTFGPELSAQYGF